MEIRLWLWSQGFRDLFVGLKLGFGGECLSLQLMVRVCGNEEFG
jgi:hypothetical protein